MGTLEQVRADVAAGLKQIDGLDVYEYLPNRVNVPCVAISVRSISYDETGSRGTDKVVLDLTVAVSRQDDERAQKLLDALLDKDGPSSIKQAAETDASANTDAPDRRVTSVDRIGALDWAGTPYLGAFLTMEVYI